jgi:hypothetical protein
MYIKINNEGTKKALVSISIVVIIIASTSAVVVSLVPSSIIKSNIILPLAFAYEEEAEEEDEDKSTTSTAILSNIVSKKSTDYEYGLSSIEGDRENNNPLGFKSIKKFDSNGKFITSWGSEGTGNGQVLHAHGIAIDSSDNVYVSDSGNVHEKKDNCTT